MRDSKMHPNDFFDWFPGHNDIDIAQHPLNAIKRSDRIVQLAQLVNNDPMDKLADIEKLIKKKLEI